MKIRHFDIHFKRTKFVNIFSLYFASVTGSLYFGFYGKRINELANVVDSSGITAFFY